MRKIFFIVAGLLSFAIQAQKIDVIYDYVRYSSTQEGPYLEMQFLFNGASLVPVKKASNQYQSTVEVKIEIRKGDSLVHQMQYELNSPMAESAALSVLNFVDIKRFALTNGIYEVTLSLRDVSNTEPARQRKDKILIDNDETKVQFSDMRFVSDIQPTKEQTILSKSGYELLPFLGNFLPKEISEIYYYYELYRLTNIRKEGEEVEVITYIETAQYNKNFVRPTKKKKVKASAKLVFLDQLDISALASGNYNLVSEVRDSNNQLLTFQKFPFQRSNPDKQSQLDSIFQEGNTFANRIINDTLLLQYIESLDVIASPQEQDYIRNQAHQLSIADNQAFFYRFWLYRNSVEPEVEWEKYKKRFDVVVKNFSSKTRIGYKSDMGRIYLKYGPPNHVVDEKSRSAMISVVGANGQVSKQQLVYLPYQIWRYDVLDVIQLKKTFIFWVQQSAGNDYELLHTDAMGELSDPSWERRLSRFQLKEGEVGEAGRQFQRGY